MSIEREHVADEILIDYTDDPASVRDRAAVEAHLASCAACSTKAEEYAAFASAMRDEETWWAAGELAGGEGLRALREHSERLAREDAEAARVLEPLLESQYRFTYGNIASKRRFQSGGVVRLRSTRLPSARRQYTGRDEDVMQPRRARKRRPRSACRGRVPG